MADVVANSRHSPPRREEAIAAIRSWIVDGRFRPGEPLVESALAGELGVSRVPVREALQTLASEGFVDITPGHTARVASPTARDLLDLFEVRAALEQMSCRYAAERRSDGDVARLHQLVDEGVAAIEQADWVHADNVNYTFHQAIATVSGNRHLSELIVGYRHKLFWLVRGTARGRGMEAWEEHRRIVELIAAGDAEQAGRVGWTHTEASKHLFLSELAAGRGGFLR